MSDKEFWFFSICCVFFFAGIAVENYDIVIRIDNVEDIIAKIKK